MSLLVTQVAKRSCAEKLGIAPGDKILEMNGETVGDFIDYQYFTAEDSLEIVFQKPDRTVHKKQLHPDPYEDFGIDFEESNAAPARISASSVLSISSPAGCAIPFISRMMIGA